MTDKPAKINQELIQAQEDAVYLQIKRMTDYWPKENINEGRLAEYFDALKFMDIARLKKAVTSIIAFAAKDSDMFSIRPFG